MAQGTGYNQIAANEVTGRRNGLTRIIVSNRSSHTSPQPDQISLAKIREALVSGVALEEFEASRSQGRFVRWLERTCRKAVKHASHESDAITPFAPERVFAAGK